MFCMLSLQRAVACEMEKGRVYLTPRDSVGKERVDWDGLVNDVFKQEVDQFYIECGVQSLYIQQQSQGWDNNNQSCSTVKESTWAPSSVSLSTSTPTWTNSNSCNSRCIQELWLKHQSPPHDITFSSITTQTECQDEQNTGKVKLVKNQGGANIQGFDLKNKL